ncbi:MAG TPA: zinc metalloprotease HtpX [Gammaproteobacteria bacterium]|nr:zinc metalloprotease HtpX [Gammaproteobacteria bacterium]
MTQPIDQFSQTTADWRGVIRSNNRKTFFVITIFILIYAAIGLLVDMYIYTGHFPQASFGEIFQALITFQIFPLVTLIMAGVAALCLFITLCFHNRLMLLGTEYREITPTTAQNPEEQKLYNVVEEMKIAAGLNYMPRVFLIEADYMNAFASGFSEKSAMLAITRGLMQKLNRDELQAVMAHELSHIRHMDIKLTLVASILANLTVMVLDMFFYNVIFSRRRSDENRSGNALLTVIIILRYLLPIINILLLLYLSRSREYMADAGCVQLTRDNQALASALLKINNDHQENQSAYNAAYQETPHENVRREAYIFDPVQAGIESTGGLTDIFSTHPNLKDRLAALGFKYGEK